MNFFCGLVEVGEDIVFEFGDFDAVFAVFGAVYNVDGVAGVNFRAATVADGSGSGNSNCVCLR
jgi:hypothetical protein